MRQATIQTAATSKAAKPALSLVSDLAEAVTMKRLMATMEAFMAADAAADQPALVQRAAA
ncbi:MAG TPA: hypothetical protein VGP48_12910 [Stellaceae bacterium]|jgi:hypothetical protein|nr:hypothetical protein [Stellaceae bacterium]